jgi:hypothetical protein
LHQVEKLELGTAVQKKGEPRQYYLSGLSSRKNEWGLTLFMRWLVETA